MQFKYNESKKPILEMKENGVSITISFSENPKSTNLMQIIVDLLTSAYEKRATA